ncbi:MAG: methylamine utilization protein [Anaerolineaceae bacterium]|nr:MAG: methylamine utilization protein [Anaerolineaceae bacterium]
MKLKNIASLFILVGLMVFAAACTAFGQPRWSEDELSTLRGLWINSLPPLPADPSNQYANNPEAAAFGQELFFDTRFSSNGEVACATCHLPDQQFQDGTPLAHGVGTTTRRTMTIIGTAYSPWLFWDGRKDSQWAQALGPMESPVEHGGNRTLYAHLIAEHYADEYTALFGPLPDLSTLPLNAGPVADPEAAANWEAMSSQDKEAVTRIYVNMGKAIAAYERLLVPGESRFDQYVEAVMDNDYQSANQILASDEIAGLKLFIGEANCTNCHNGPLFTNNDFHNTGIPSAPGLPEDNGRAKGAQQVQADEFNCLSSYSDAQPEQCSELNFLVIDEHQQERQFKPPSLRNVSNRGPFMHAGQFATLVEVLNHYNTAPAAPAGHSELEPLNLTQKQIEQIIAFLKTLNSPINADPKWLIRPN